MFPMYDPDAVRPMAEELEVVGVRSLKTGEEVDEVMKNASGTTLVVVNSVCGCAAGGARPGVMMALQNEKIPATLATVFAGVDREAVEQARSYMTGIQPSSPCIALFKDGRPIHVLERRHIEQMDADMVAASLRKAFDEHCEGQGPSISAEEFSKLEFVQQCGSEVPRFGG